MRLIILGLFIITTGCTKMPVIPSSSTWITYDLAIDIKTNDVTDLVESLVLNELVKKELIGTKLVFNQNTFSLSFTNNGKEKGDVSDVIKITKDYFIVKKEGVEQKIIYQMSNDGQQCDFTLPDGTILKTKRKN